MMTDRKALLDSNSNETPEDVATLYSWANLHGAKYRDFSASRAQTREKARQRVQQAIEEERVKVRQEAEAQHAAEAKRLADGARVEEEARQAQLEAQHTAQLVAQQAAYEAAQEVARQAAQQAAMQAAHQAQLAQQAAQQAQATQQAQQAAQQAQAAQQTVWQRPQQDRFAAFSAPAPTRQAAPYDPPQPQAQPAAQVPPQSYRPAASPSQFAPMREDNSIPPRRQWAAAEPREVAAPPAWLRTDHVDVSVPPVAPQVPEDTLQGARDRLTSRWFALNGVFDSSAAPAEAAPAPTASRAPVLAVFSLAGGVGKTSLVATLGRALSARGERVLLVDTAAYGLLPFFFGARDQRPGVLRTFSPPVASGDAPIQMVTFDPEAQSPETAGQEPLVAEITKYSRGVNRVIVDLATASGATTRRVMRMSPLVLVPVVPDMNSVVSVSSIEAFFQHNSNVSGKPALPYYVLNQFDPSLPLHLDIREILREQLGDRLLPFALRRAPAVSEALAEGMTVMDYAPNSTAAEDFGNLAGWVKSLSAPASSGFRGVRWSER
jgi:cellulose synthase operon protein YhjQ